MDKIRNLVCAAIVGWLIFGCGVQAQVPSDWTLEIQCRSSLDGSIPPFNLPFPSSLSSQYVAIDEDGGVATRFVTSGGASEGIFYGRHGQGGPILLGNSPDPLWSSDMSARGGLIAVSELTFGGGGFVIDIQGNPVLDYPAGGPEGVSDFTGISLLTGGAVAYRANFGSFKKTLIDEYVGQQRVQTLYASTLGGEFSFLFSPTANDARQIACKVLDAGGRQQVIRFEPDGSRTTIADATSHSRFVNSVDMAQNGLVAFNGRRVGDGVDEIVVSDGVQSTRIAQVGDLGIFDDEFTFWPPSVNASGWVAFRAIDASGEAVFVGDGQTLVRVVGDGDIVQTDLGPMRVGFDFGGNTGRQAVNARVQINDAGQVALALFLENGTIGVFVATPLPGCEADLDGDGDADADDFFAYLDAFAGGETGVCDRDSDGDCDADDFFAYLDQFAAGC